MNTKVILFVLVISAILIAGCSTSGGGSYNNNAPTGGAVAGGGGCGRFASVDNAGCDIARETATIEAVPGF